ncbi:hypothetical protein D5H75_35515 [Bailinhaonella thermotolerans]|uniref:DUF5667 domain-containing protein n=1 Tax=Bailinhaonella thermotolerans TaxID=1070861 RepID=A0A3A4AAS6_9ACTN|nr:hypothetical protein D5H75_35515 [Bailinhaonella thermotolerans]
MRHAGLISAVGAVLIAFVQLTASALPGDTLYGVKRAAEATWLDLSGDEFRRAERTIDAASTRAREAEELARSQADEQLISRALDDMEQQTKAAVELLTKAESGGDGDSAKVLDEFTTHQRRRVAPLVPRLRGDSRERAAGYLKMIEGVRASAGGG